MRESRKQIIENTEKLIIENFHSVSKKLGMITEEAYDLLTHQEFKNLAHFEEEPTDTEVIKIVSKTFNKRVTDYELLDRENILFNFDDGSNVELLLRKSKYV